MRRTLFTMIIGLIVSVWSYGQPLTGTKNIPGDYTTFSNAIFALNSLGAGPGGVTFIVAGGYTETLPTLTSGLITATGTASDPIVFQWSGTGAHPVISGCTTAPNTTDYVIGFQGSDYITFNGIDVADPTGVIEWGYAVLKASAQDGSQYVIIKNCNITLKPSNTATVAIYSANVTPGAPTIQLSVDAAAGANSNNKFYGNSITSCYSGIIIAGFADPSSPYAFYDQANEIGKDGGNTITSQGGSTVASFGILTSYQDRLVIANNTVNGPVSGTGACSGIQMNTANNANVSVYGNTISIQYSGTSTSLFYGIYNNMGTTFTNNTYNFYNNVITNCTYTTAQSGICYYIYNGISAANVNWHDCQVTNNTYGGTAAATAAVYYMYLAGSPAVGSIVNFNGNSVTGNTRAQLSTGSGTTYYMYISGGGVGVQTNVYENLIDNNTSNTTGAAYCYYFLNGANIKNFYNNTLTNHQNARGTIYGFYTGNGYNTFVYNNKIQNLNAIASSSLVYGLYLASSTGTGIMHCYNNYVSELKTPNSTAVAAQTGIYAGASSTSFLGIYYNTVYLDGTSTGMGFGSVGLFVSSSPGVAEVRNNIIVNNTTPTGSGLATAFKSDALLASNLAASSNNNNYFAGVPGTSHLIFNDGANTAQTINAYKARVFPKEGSSLTENPPFMQVVTTPYDLHLDNTVPTQCESAGLVISTPISITSDYDYNARYPITGYPNNASYPATATDLGADEFGGIPSDLTTPAIIYAPFMNTSSLLDRTLTATITDMSGVPVSGTGLPQICWKKNFNGAWTYVTGVSMGSSQYSFTFGSGVAVGDTVHYFVVAQDNFSTPNVGTFPILGSGGFSSNPPMATVPPAPASKYVIIQGICGTKTVGTGKDYPTLTVAINDVNSKELTCPVVLELTDNLYNSETYPIIINQIPGASAVNTLTIRPAAGATPYFTTSYLGLSPEYWSMISLNGAQYVTIDGSNSGGTDKSLTFQNTAPAGFAAAIGLYNNGTQGAAYFTVKNCIIQAHTDNVYNAQGITLYSISGNAGYHDIVIQHNTINSAKFGITLNGIANNKTTNVEITDNLIGDMSLTIAQYAIQMSYTENVLIKGNEMIGAVQGMSVAPVTAGIYINTGCTNTKIRKNIIHDFRQLGTAFPTNGALGIVYLAEATTVTEITDNLIYNIKSPGQNTSVTGANPFGIMINQGGNVKIQHNTIYMGGNYLSATVTGMSSCIGIGNNVTALDIRDNILKNSSQPISGTPATKSYCITMGTNPILTNINNNDYFCDGIGAQIGYFGGADKTTLASWQAATGQDANSVNIDPVFTSGTNFQPTTTSMVKAGVYLPSLPTDITGGTRTNPPDIGAYEYSPMPAVSTTAATDLALNGVTLNGTINPNALDANLYFDYGLTTNYGATVNGTPFIVNGGLLLTISAPVTGLAEYTTYHFRFRAVTFSGVNVYGNDMTFTTLSSIPANSTVSGNISEGSQCFNALNTITVAGGGSTFEVQSGASVTMVAGEKISFLPGTRAYNNSYLHAYIYNGTWCNSTDAIVAAVPVNEKAVASLEKAHFGIYPNPTNGNVTLVQRGETIYSNLKVEVYSLHGERVMTETMIGEKSHEFRFSEMNTGVYFVKIVAEGYVETIKLVKF